MTKGKDARNVAPGFFRESKVQIILILLGIFTLGAFFSILITPDLLNVDANLHALDTFSAGGVTRSLSSRLREWIPKENWNVHGLIQSPTHPDFSVAFWTPIDIEFDDMKNPTITLCKLNFKEHSQNPHLYAMFRDLEKVSNCNGQNRRRQKMNSLLQELDSKKGTPEGNVIEPTGFVFHESRVGSTLVANTLASDPFSMVFSESAPPANTLLHMPSGATDRMLVVQTFRNVLRLMGNSPVHKRMFFKFQSITATKMDIVLEAFPNTPFAFVYRNSVQTMMSHMDPRKGPMNSPCLRSMRGATPAGVSDAMKLGGVSDAGKAPREAWCAAHLAMLCENAIAAYAKHGVTHDEEGHLKQRGALINYESLPGAVPRTLLPLFGVEPDKNWLAKMEEESTMYSKGKGTSKTFSSDNQDKEKHATEEIKKYATSILDSKYDKMATIGLDSLQAISPDSYHLVVPSDRPQDVRSVDWTPLKGVPEYSTLPHVIRKALEDEESAKQAEQQAIAAAKLAIAESREKSVNEEKNAKLTALESAKNGGPLQLNLRGHADEKDQAEHSHTLKERDFIPWSPWSNTHHSKSFSPAGKCKSVKELGDSQYPKMFSLVDILNNWNTDNTEIPDYHYDTMCHFDYSNPEQRAIAREYRNAELPFVVYNVPEIENVVKKWSDLDYLHKRIGNKRYRTEVSEDNHFMYWTSAGGKKTEGWKAPTSVEKATFEEFLEVAVRGQNQTLEGRDYKYFRVSTDHEGDENTWLNEELPFFSGLKPSSLFMKEPDQKRGIHCRFGMRAVTSETHYDGSRNSVVQLGGLRRWILFHPNQCDNLYLYPEGHPSSRHTKVDWSGNVEENVKNFPDMAKLVAHEAILQPGDLLFIPTHWFHHIISLNLNYQCNCRSGRDYLPYKSFIQSCGFHA